MRGIVLALALALCAPPLWGADQKTKPKSPLEQLQAISEEFEKQEEELKREFRAAKEPAEKQKVLEKYKALVRKAGSECLAIVAKHPDDPAAADGLLWVATHPLPGGPNPNVEKALSLLTEKYAKSDHLGLAIPMLAQLDSPGVEALLRAILANNPKPEVQALAALTLAQYLKNQSEEEGRKADADKLRKEAEKYFQLVLDKYGTVKLGGRNLAEAAKSELFELQHLSIGKQAPEIQGSDADGKKFKLSDYRGKVVVLDFWATW